MSRASSIAAEAPLRHTPVEPNRPLPIGIAALIYGLSAERLRDAITAGAVRTVLVDGHECVAPADLAAHLRGLAKQFGGFVRLSHPGDRVL